MANIDAIIFAKAFKVLKKEGYVYLKYHDPKRGTVYCMPIEDTVNDCLEISCEAATETESGRSRKYSNIIAKRNIILSINNDGKLISQRKVTELLGLDNRF
jgi:hypothetical protein